MDELDQDNKPAIIAGDLDSFFGSLLRDAAQLQNLFASPLAIEYVSKLFVRFADVEAAFFQEGVTVPVLADLMQEAREAETYRKYSILQKLGDTSLMVSGYFPEALQKRNVDVRYYVQMGEFAYSQLDDLSERRGVYGELSDRFLPFTNLIQHVSVELRTQDSGPEELLQMYSQSKNPGILRKLQTKGIFPLAPKKET